MIDYTETKVVDLNGNSYTIGKVSKKVFAMFNCALAECESIESEVAVAYNYIPFFLKSATVGSEKMPGVIGESDGRTRVEHADYQWVADNIDGIDIMELFVAAIDFNSVSEELKKK